MKILMTGGTGFIGQKLGQELVRRGHQLTVVTRSAAKAKLQLSFPAEILEWDLQTKPLSSDQWPAVHAVIHLMGENVGEGRWTHERKEQILKSRKEATENLLCYRPPSVQTILSAAAVGIYPDREPENSPEGWQESAMDCRAGSHDEVLVEGFLAKVCWSWERTLYDFLKNTKDRKDSPREVIFRLGVVLGENGGALAKMLPLFKNRLGAPLGNGEQLMSWIHREDVVSAFCQALENSRFQGVYNLVAPEAVTNRMFTESLCKKLDVMMGPAVPKTALRLFLGEMADMVLVSQHVSAEKILGAGFHFKFPDLSSALADCLRFENLEESLFFAEQYLDLPVEKAFEFFAEAKNLEAITPPLLKFSIEKMNTLQIEEGTEIDYKLKIHGIPTHWKTLIREWKPPYQFVDEQLKGPYTQWIHLHEFIPLGQGTLMRDLVRYKMPMGALGKVVAGRLVRSDIEEIFNYRRQRVPELLLKEKQ